MLGGLVRALKIRSSCNVSDSCVSINPLRILFVCIICAIFRLSAYVSISSIFILVSKSIYLGSSCRQGMLKTALVV